MPSTNCTHRALADARLSAAGPDANPMSHLLRSGLAGTEHEGGCASSSPLLLMPITVTRPSLVGCLNWRWLPLLTWCSRPWFACLISLCVYFATAENRIV